MIRTSHPSSSSTPTTKRSRSRTGWRCSPRGDRGGACALRHRRRDGSFLWFEVTNHNLLEDPEHECVVSEIVDISEEMAAQEGLRAREQLLDRLAEAVPMGLFQVDAERNVVYTNDRLHADRRRRGERNRRGAVARRDRRRPRGARAGARSSLATATRLTSRSVPGCPPAPSSGSARSACAPSATRTAPISGAIACVADVTDSAQMRDRNFRKKRATFDELTGCYNRASIMLALEAELAAGEPGAGAPWPVSSISTVSRRSTIATDTAPAMKSLRVLAARSARMRARRGNLVGRIGGCATSSSCSARTRAGGEQAMQARRAASPGSPQRGCAGFRRAATVSHQISVGVAWSDCAGCRCR